MFHFNLSRKRLFKQLGCLAVSMLFISYSVYTFPLQDRGVALPRIQVGEAGRILIWKVGSPHNGDTPDKTIPLELRQAAKKLGVSIQIEAFPAKGFADLYFIAVADHQEPDILAFDNYGIIEGITTKLGNFTGIGSSRQVKQSLVFVSESLKSLESGRGGWQCLIATSANHKAARP